MWLEDMLHIVRPPCSLNAEIERDRLTEEEADVLAQKTALMLCLNAGIEGVRRRTAAGDLT